MFLDGFFVLYTYIQLLEKIVLEMFMLPKEDFRIARAHNRLEDQ